MLIFLSLAMALLAGSVYVMYRLGGQFKADSTSLRDYFRTNRLFQKTPVFQFPWLKAQYDFLVHSRKTLLTALGKNSQIGSSLAIGIAKVSHFIQQLHDKIQEQQQRTDNVASATEQLSANTSQIASAASQASEYSKRASEATNESISQVQMITQGINQLKGTVSDTSTSMNELYDHVQDIQGITDVIDNVAEQTNLLALNAAIEAARAGEHGRGFAVVADEVRELANKSSTYTREIDEKLHAMVAVSKHTAEEITNFQQMVELVVLQINQIGDVLNNITTETTMSEQHIGQISHVMDEHLSAVNQIAEEVSYLRSSFDQVLVESDVVSTDAFKLSDQAEAIYEISADYEFGSYNDKVKNIAIDTAKRIGKLFEESVASGRISEAQLFDKNYRPIRGSNPQKFHTEFDQFTDEVLPSIQESLMEQNPEFILAGAVDVNGYFPTHNKKYSKPLTGKYEIDLVNNRTKRIFNDRTGARCGSNTEPFLLQTYKRDTGEVIHDLSAPIYVNGRHWGGFRIGYEPQETGAVFEA